MGIPELFMHGGHALGDFLAPVFAESQKVAGTHTIDHQTEWILVGASVLVALAGAIAAWGKYRRYTEHAPRTALGRTLANKWYVDEAYDRAIVQPVVGVSRRLLWTVTDKWLIDGLLVNGSARLMKFVGRVGSYLQTGSVSTYAWAIVLGVLVVLGAFTLR